MLTSSSTRTLRSQTNPPPLQQEPTLHPHSSLEAVPTSRGIGGLVQDSAFAGPSSVAQHGSSASVSVGGFHGRHAPMPHRVLRSNRRPGVPIPAINPNSFFSGGGGGTSAGAGVMGGGVPVRGRPLERSVRSMPNKRMGDDDDLAGIVKNMKRMKVDEYAPVNFVDDVEPTVSAVVPSQPGTPEFPEADEFDDLDGTPVHSRRVSTSAPGGQLDDDASDYFPSDIEENEDRATPASTSRRRERAEKIVHRMKSYFEERYRVPSHNLFDVVNPAAGGERLPCSWLARLRRFNPEEGRWVEKGPVVAMLLPCRPEAPWEARLVAHYTFGTMSAAVNMPISPFHHLAIHCQGRRVLLSSLGTNVIGKAFISQQPRKLREVLAPLNQRDAKRLEEAESKSSGGAGGTTSSATSGDSGSTTPILRGRTTSTKRIRSARSGPAGTGSVSGSAVGGNGDERAGGGRRGRGERAVMEMEEEEEDEDEGNKDREGVAGGVSAESLASGAVGVGNSDYLYECRTTVMGIKEDAASLYIFRFQTRQDAASFYQRFCKASLDYGLSLAEQRFDTFVQPQPARRLLLSGHLLAKDGEPALHVSPYARDPHAARALASNGLSFAAVSSDAVLSTLSAAEGRKNALSPGSTPLAVTEQRYTCWHCGAMVSVPIPLGMVAEGATTDTRTAMLPAPAVEEIMAAHRAHSFATRWEPTEAFHGRHGAAHAKSGVRQAYRCLLAFGDLPGQGGLVELPAAEAPVGRTKKSMLEPLVVQPPM
ncbi:hypothetical protein HDU96_006489 [Phlyctochytrium bullatum]|nr:hypothetical protein HDU96_006489 [Phlyctochytrium bullatum]